MGFDDFDRSNYERQNQRQQHQGGDYAPWEMEKMTFSPGETFYLRFLATNSIFSRPYHWPGGGVTDTCTADHPLFGGKCVYCQHFGKGDKGRQQFRDVLEVIDFRYFHIVPSTKKQGKNTVERCLHDEPQPKNNRCHLCNDSNPAQAQRYFGGHKLLELNNDQYLQVMGTHEKLSGVCVADIGDGKICGKKNFPVAFICPNCEEVLLPEGELRKAAPAQIATYRRTKQKCKCGAEDYPYGIYACEGDGRTPTPSEIKNGTAPDKGSHWVVRGSLFDKVLECTVSGEKKNIGGNNVELKHLSFSTGEDWSRIEDDLAHFGFNPEEITEMCKPWDLNEMYAPGAYVKDAPKRKDFGSDEEWVAAMLDMQAANCGKPNPYGGASGGSRSFGGGKGGVRSFKRP